MTEAATTTPPGQSEPKKKGWGDNPEEYRMTLGEHLEELRWRLILALGGLGVVLIACLYFGTTVVSQFCKPLYDVLQTHDINPQLFYTTPGESFMVFIRISVICAAAISAPWILYQLWLFIAAGLYPNERKAITRYLPLSIALLIAGMLFVYFLVLPWTLQFFIDFGSSIPMPQAAAKVVPAENFDNKQLVHVPSLDGDPVKPDDYSIWYDKAQRKLKFHLQGQTRVLQFLPESLVAPHITLDTYIDMVVMMLITFALAFQLPLVVMAIIRIGLVEPAAMKRGRKIVYFVLAILAACITPGDVITATIALMVPLVLLYELGIFLGVRGLRRAEAARAAEEAAEKAAEEAERAAAAQKATENQPEIPPEDRMK